MCTHTCASNKDESINCTQRPSAMHFTSGTDITITSSTTCKSDSFFQTKTPVFIIICKSRHNVC